MYDVKIKYLNDKCRVARATEGAFAMDVVANIEEPITIESGKMASIPLGIKIDTGHRDVGVFLMMRSGLAFKHGLMLVNSVGLIDSDYRGEYIAGIWNTGRVGDYTIKPYERVGQICFMEQAPVWIFEVDELSETERGDGAFGHTGRQASEVFDNLVKGEEKSAGAIKKYQESEKTVLNAFSMFLGIEDEAKAGVIRTSVETDKYGDEKKELGIDEK